MSPDLGLGVAASRRRRARPRGAPLDAFAPALFAAFGLRRLRTGHAGPLLRVRRGADNAQQDVGPGSGGWLDVAALLAWAGASSAHVVTWYDQSGNGHHVTQPSAAAQPRLVNAGALEAAPNGRPCMRFAGQWLTNLTAAWSAPALHVSLVAALEGTTNWHKPLALGANLNAGGVNLSLLAPASIHGTQAGDAVLVGNGYGATQAPRITLAVPGLGGLHSHQAGLSAAGNVWLIDGVGAAVRASLPAAVPPATRLVIGANGDNGGGDALTGSIAEIALIGAALAGAQAAALSAEHRAAWGTP